MEYLLFLPFLPYYSTENGKNKEIRRKLFYRYFKLDVRKIKAQIITPPLNPVQPLQTQPYPIPVQPPKYSPTSPHATPKPSPTPPNATILNSSPTTPNATPKFSPTPQTHPPKSSPTLSNATP